MEDLTRREALRRAAAPGLAVALVPAPSPRSDEPGVEPAEDQPKTDRDFVTAAGMTPDEADCWAAIAEAAGKFFQLPELHPMDRQEVASAIHIVQNKLLSRPTYRKYLELAKAAAGK